MIAAPDFDFFQDRYPKRTRKLINKPDAGSFVEESEDEVLFQKPKLMSHCLYDIQEIVSSSEFNDDSEMVKTIDLKEFNLEYIKKNGLSTPLLFNNPPEELGMTVPEAENFTVYDVMDLVGKSRKIEVVEVNEQKGRSMKLSDFITYYTSPAGFRNELLNVLSLEFSLTNLANCVSGPKFVSEIDWIDNVWPKELKERQIVHMQSNGQYSDFSTYPKVQRYCLMSVANCFTDFHIDFGGTSVWYHILKGKKIFWLIEPTEENILLYEEWILGGNNSESFFGRIVNKCIRVELNPGNTFIIPSGWIHCVYTPEDSLVFGGNFLHSYAVPMQTRVVRSEDRIKVGGKYRFPHFKQMIWYAIEDVVRKATSRLYLKPINIKGYLESQEASQREIVVGGQVQKLSSLEEAMNNFLGAEEAETDGSATDDQEEVEPSCSSAVQTGCKKSGQEVKDSFLSGMGMEESESEDEDAVSAHTMLTKDKEKEVDVVPEVDDDPNVFYDNLPNGADGYYNLVPTQMKFGQKDYLKDFKPVDSYNQDFLDNVSPLELNGYSSLLEYAKKLIKSKRPEVGEGITRPRHLLLEFERLVHYLSNLDKLTISKTIDMSNKGVNKKARNVTVELNIVAKQIEFGSLSIALPKNKRKYKRKSLNKSDDSLAAKKTPKPTKKTSDSSHPHHQQPGPFIDGAPLPTQSADAAEQAPNPYGFNPLDAAVALGKKPLPSAFRRSSNMATAPLPQKFKLKKLSEQHSPAVKPENQQSTPGETDLIGRIMKDEVKSTSTPHHTKSFGSSHKSSMKPSSQTNAQRLSMHSDDPIWSTSHLYRSRLSNSRKVNSKLNQVSNHPTVGRSLKLIHPNNMVPDHVQQRLLQTILDSECECTTTIASFNTAKRPLRRTNP
uniref:JmjC domain-containing protein n=1 Tax=Ditylenchus dipsaci TaxID=166011 RepID=A0A915CM40_9BILA